MAHTPGITRWWWVATAPIQISGVYVGQKNETPIHVDSSVFELLASIIPPPKLIYASPLKRAIIPAEQLHKLKEAKGEVVTLDGFNEQDFGAWEGKNFAEVQKLVEADQPVSHADIAKLAADGGESFLDVVSRVGLAIDTIGYQIADSKPNGPVDVLCVAPISVIRTAIAKALNVSPEHTLSIHLQPLSLTILEHHEHFGWLCHTTGWTPWPVT